MSEFGGHGLILIPNAEIISALLYKKPHIFNKKRHGERLMQISPEELEELKAAKNLLENPSLSAKITNFLGSPIEKGFERLPVDWK